MKWISGLDHKKPIPISKMKQYVILSLKHSSKNEAVFWMDDNAGYTTSPFQAGIYSEKTVMDKYDYYNDSGNMAICITDALSKTGLSITIDKQDLNEYRNVTRQRKSKYELQKQTEQNWNSPSL